MCARGLKSASVKPLFDISPFITIAISGNDRICHYFAANPTQHSRQWSLHFLCMEKSQISFGKYKGKTFDWVVENDKQYCSWLRDQNDPFPCSLEFVNYLKQNFTTDNTTKSPRTPKKSPVTKLQPGKNIKLQSGEWISKTPERKMMYSNTPILSNLDENGEKELSSGASFDSLEDSNILDDSKIDRPNTSTPKKLSPSIRTISVPKIPLGFDLNLEVISSSSFTIRAAESGKPGRRNFGGLFIPHEIKNIISSSQLRRHVHGNIIDSEAYGPLLDLLKQSFETQIECIPDFVLRCFKDFRPFAKPFRLQRKCANVLLGDQTPKTLERASKAGALVGEKLCRELKAFQIEGVEFGLRKNGRCLIGDEMGLGKTLQALAICACYHDEWPVLVVCPSSIRFQWKDQAMRWLEHLIHETEIEIVKNGKHEIASTAKLVIISFDMLAKNSHFQKNFAVIVVDESHYIKSITAARTKIVMPMVQKARRAMLLSGTPALNKPSELYSQLHALVPDFTTVSEFANRYCQKKFNPFSRREEFYDSRNTKELNLLLNNTCMIRRLKRDVQTELPDKLRTRVPLECKDSDIKMIKEKMKDMGLEGDMSSLANVTASASEDGAEETKNSRTLISELFTLTGRAKIRGASEYVEYMLKECPKFLVFAHHAEMLDGLEKALRKLKTGFVRIDGKVPTDKREGLVKHFVAERDCRVALLSITACGHGLNLTVAGTVIFAELYWVPGQMIQAEDRCHRMGTQHSNISVHYLIAEDTVDDLVWRTINKKWQTVTSTLDGTLKNIDVEKNVQKFQLKRGSTDQGEQGSIVQAFKKHKTDY
eukprot:GHVP01070089.1.p1 GENE.GHVP01070089.1~~GHVP01070089.1.p1  ORF type:complete len:823 (-),score=120.03 GHVP01070089.1:1945-4413(-)